MLITNKQTMTFVEIISTVCDLRISQFSSLWMMFDETELNFNCQNRDGELGKLISLLAETSFIQDQKYSE